MYIIIIEYRIGCIMFKIVATKRSFTLSFVWKSQKTMNKANNIFYNLYIIFIIGASLKFLLYIVWLIAGKNFHPVNYYVFMMIIKNATIWANPTW